MLAELKDRSQVTIPKSVVNQLGLQTGDQFEIVVIDGEIHLVPVVVYPKAKVAQLERLALQVKAQIEDGTADIFDNPNDLLDLLHTGD